MALFRVHHVLVPLLLLAGCGAESREMTPASAEASHSPFRALTIATKNGARQFKVEVAATPEEQAKGLMFRPKLGPDRGMIFPFPAPRVAAFWMKNTPVSLDLIFIREDGTIARIAPDAVPYSLDMITVGEPVIAVLEIAGGGAARAGIAEGDVVSGIPPAAGS